MNNTIDIEPILDSWLAEAGVDVLPDRSIEAVLRTVERTSQRAAWRVPWRTYPLETDSQLGRLRGLPVAAAVVVVMALAGFVLLNSRQGGLIPATSNPPANSNAPDASSQPALSLPTMPDDWTRVTVRTETDVPIGSVVDLAASSNRLLAVIGQGTTPDKALLAVSTDGETWGLIPESESLILSTPADFGFPNVVGTDEGLLLQQLGEVWSSDDGLDWKRLAIPTSETEIGMNQINAVSPGGPGLVAVGQGRAWYSEDGKAWEAAQVPPPPSRIQALPEGTRHIAMTGVVAAGNLLIAWGSAEANDGSLRIPLLWTSSDGRTWANVNDVPMGNVTSVTDGPHGLVAIGRADGQLSAWLSADGLAWEQLDVLESGTWVAATPSSSEAGYVIAAGTDCNGGRCDPSTPATVFTSPDGRTWSQLPSDERFARSGATQAAAFGDRFAVGGGSDRQPIVWISNPSGRDH
jgi:hypothetical protein